MSETLSVTRLGRTPTSAIELIHSPDDGGYYLGQTDFRGIKGQTRRSSVKVYRTEAAAKADWNAGTVEWEEWH